MRFPTVFRQPLILKIEAYPGGVHRRADLQEGDPAGGTASRECLYLRLAAWRTARRLTWLGAGGQEGRGQTSDRALPGYCW